MQVNKLFLCGFLTITLFKTSPAFAIIDGNNGDLLLPPAARTRPMVTAATVYEGIVKFHRAAAQYARSQPGSSSALNPLIQEDLHKCIGPRTGDLSQITTVHNALCRRYRSLYDPAKMQGLMRTLSKNSIKQMWKKYKKVFWRYLSLIIHSRALNGADHVNTPGQKAIHEKMHQIQWNMTHLLHLQGGSLTGHSPNIQGVIKASIKRQNSQGFLDFLKDFVQNFPSQSEKTMGILFTGYHTTVQDYIDSLNKETRKQGGILNHGIQDWPTHYTAIQNPHHLFHRADDAAIMGGGPLGIQCLTGLYKDLKTVTGKITVSQDSNGVLHRWMTHFDHVYNLYQFYDITPATSGEQSRPYLDDFLLDFKNLKDQIGALTRDGANITKTILTLARGRGPDTTPQTDNGQQWDPGHDSQDPPPTSP